MKSCRTSDKLEGLGDKLLAFLVGHDELDSRLAAGRVLCRRQWGAIQGGRSVEVWGGRFRYASNVGKLSESDVPEVKMCASGPPPGQWDPAAFGVGKGKWATLLMWELHHEIDTCLSLGPRRFEPNISSQSAAIPSPRSISAEALSAHHNASYSCSSGLPPHGSHDATHPRKCSCLKRRARKKDSRSG